MQMSKVLILMSVYNGEKYLVPQLESIFSQIGVEVSMLVRDDGSNDSTLSILHQYSEKNEISIISGPNLGAARSFMSLIENCHTSVDYYAFSDADDVWLPDKLIRGVEILGENDKVNCPAVVVSKMTVVDSELVPKCDTAEPLRGFSFNNAIIQTITSGAASILNEAAFSLIRKSLPNYVVMHDSWMYMVISAFGRVYYDSEPRLLYRQHGSNVAGTAHGFRIRWTNRIKRVLEVSDRLPQAVEFKRLFGEHLDEDKRIILDSYIDYRKSMWNKIRYCARPSVHYQRRLSNCFLRLLILIGRA